MSGDAKVYQLPGSEMPCPPVEPEPAALTLSASLDVDQAELFLLGLDTEMLTADAPRTAYLLGLAEGHLANLVELVRAVTR
jgi:hypothetical protein